LIEQKDVQRISRKTGSIEGWFSAGAASIFAILNKLQTGNGVTGNLFEIGVHHRKSAIFLAHLRNSQSELLGVCDIFGDQHLNISSSGNGDEQIMNSNFRSFFQDSDNFLRVFSKSSAELVLDETTNNCRIFHIDGGHSVEEALSDLELAASALNPQGAIVIDDAFHPDWPGVTEAIVKFLAANTERYVPLIIAFGKLTIVPKPALEMYTRGFGDNSIYQSFIPEPALNPEVKTLVGSPVFTVPSWRQKFVQSWLYEKQLSSRWAESVMKSLRIAKSILRR
jgi:hypothetical protein